MKKFIVLFSAITIGSSNLSAQLIDAEPEVTNLCTGGAATLTATITPPGSGGAPGSLPTTDYALSTIPYAPDPLTAGTAVTLSDDSQTGLLPIGFTFCYFGNSYTQFIIGSNNWIGFQTGETSTWVTAPIPNVSGAIAPRNTIMGPWQDINPGAGGSVRYAVYGTAPFRRLSVSWNNVPMFSCSGQLYSSQIIIYESTNVIETHILNKSLCTSWNSGNAVHGLHNSTGTVAITVPGRNNTQWTANNEGRRFTPNGTATYTIEWYILPANTLIGTGPSITVTPPTSPQYYYAKVVGPNGCGAGSDNTDTVVVFSSPIFADAGPYTTICEGQSTMLIGISAGPASYSWSPSTGLNDPNIQNPVASPTTTTTYTLMVTNSLGCAAFDTVTIGVNPMPFVDAGFSAGICSGDNIMLAGNGNTGTYSWSPGATLDDSTILTPTASPVVTTNYTLTITNGNGCSGSDTVSVFILNPGASAGPDVSICPGFTAQLNASGGDVFLWSPGATLSDSTIANPVASPAVTTSYAVVVTNSSTGCSATDSITVNVTPSVIADAGTDTSICIGNNTILEASGGTSYAWAPTASLSDSTIFNPVASPTTTTTYTVIVTDASGCVSSDSVTVNVNMLPNVNAGNDLAICIGTSASMNVTGASVYSWSPGSTLNDSTIFNPVASPVVPTTYIVTGTDVNGCVSTDTISISINSLTITASTTDNIICAGDSTTLNVSGGLTYMWSPTGSLSDSIASSTAAAPDSTTMYTVIGTDVNGCLDTATVSITVNQLPPVLAGPSQSICNGSSANLTVTGADTYVWSPAGTLNNANIPNPTATPSTTTTYIVTGTDINGCSSQDTVTIVVSPVPVANAGSNMNMCAGDSVTLNGSGAGSYSWSPSTGLSNPSIASPKASPAATTTYTLTVSVGSCSSSSQVTITVNPVPTASASADVSICNGGSAQLTASGGTSYFWTPGSGLNNSNIANPVASPGTTTQYTVTVSTAAGCTATETVLVSVSNSITIGNLISTNETCTNNNGTIVVSGVSGGANPYSYSINGGSSQNNPAFNNLSQGTYLVTVTDALGCQVTQTANIGVISNVNASFTVDPASGPKPLSVNLTNTSTGATSYFWNLGNGTSSSMTNTSTVYPESGTYTVTLYAYNGGPPCLDSATITIEVYDEVIVAIPNIFTPNGDNKNDYFEIQSSGVTELNGEIYNRWGRKVYEWSGDAQSKWDGSINGSQAQDGTYFYILRIKGADGTEMEQKGHVQVLTN